MTRKLEGLLGAALAMLGMASADADVWIAHAGVLERRAADGSVLTSITFNERTDTLVRQAAVDPSTGNLWVVYLQLEEWSTTPVVHVLGVTPSGDEIWQRTETGTGYVAPSSAIDSVRHGIWVLRAVAPGASSEMEASLYDQGSGNLLATVHGLSRATIGAVGPDGAVWIASDGDYIRLQGAPDELDGYQVIGSEGLHHRTFPFEGGTIIVFDPSDGSFYHNFGFFDSSTDEGEFHLVKRSADGDELFRVRYPVGIYESISDIAIDPRDGSVYVTFGFYKGRILHVSSLGEELGVVSYLEHVNSVTVDPDSAAVWIGHMPHVDDDKALVAPMILRKLDGSLQTTLEVPFPGVVNVIGAAPGSASLEISLDIQPQNKRHVVDLTVGHGEVRAALLSSLGFDPLQVDIDTIRFGSAGAVVRSHWIRDVNRDGIADLVVTFKTQHTGIKCGDTAATLTAQTYSGVAVHGSGLLCTKCVRAGNGKAHRREKDG